MVRKRIIQICFICLFLSLTVLPNVWKRKFYNHYVLKNGNMYSICNEHRLSCNNHNNLCYFDDKIGGVVIEQENINKNLIPIKQVNCMAASDQYIYIDTQSGLYQFDLNGEFIARDEIITAAKDMVVMGKYLFVNTTSGILVLAADSILRQLDWRDVVKDFKLVDRYYITIPYDQKSFGTNGYRRVCVCQYCYEECALICVRKSEGELIMTDWHGHPYCNFWWPPSEEGLTMMFNKEGLYTIFEVESEHSWYLYGNNMYLRKNKWSVCQLISEDQVTSLSLLNSHKTPVYQIGGVLVSTEGFVMNKYAFDHNRVAGDSDGLYDMYDRAYIYYYNCASSPDGKEISFSRQDYFLYGDDMEYIVFNDCHLEYYDMKTDMLIDVIDLPEFVNDYTYIFERCGEKILLFEQEGINNPLGAPRLVTTLDLYPNRGLLTAANIS